MPAASSHPSATAGDLPQTGGGLRARGLGLIAFGGSMAVLGVAAGLEPSGGGLGTHRQLGLPECGWITTMDLPCPTCGMTTSFSHAADGDLLASIATQPFGAALAVATAAVAVGSAWTVATGTPVFGRLLGHWWRPRTGWFVGGALLVAWIYKMAAHRGLL